MTPDVDVLIAGGGYSAQIAARELLAHGFSVMMVDRRTRPGWPPQSTSGLARAWIERFDLPVMGESTPITSFRVIGPGGEQAMLGGGLLGEVGDTMVEPDLLARMERASVAQGLLSFHNSTVMRSVRSNGVWSSTVRNPDRVFQSRYVFDATGFQAWVARQAGLAHDLGPEDAHGGVEVTVPRPAAHPQGEVRMWLGHRVAPWGYAWAFPSTENGLPHVRVGIGTPRAVPDSAGIWFTRFLAAHPEYAGSVHHRVGGIIPTAPVSKVLQRDGLFLLGDAARLCCPLTGGGILGALASGDAAAHAVVEDAPETYPDKIGWLVRELRTRWMLKQIVYGLNDGELGRLVRFLGDIDLPSDGSVNPLRERRRVTRKLIRSDPGIVLSLFTRGRLMRALLPAG